MSKNSISRRFPIANNGDSSILANELQFKTSGQKAQNRFLKASMSEVMASYSDSDLSTTGIPSQRLINLYEKWAHGGFGMISTGNFIIDHRHIEAAGNVVVSRETDSAEKKAQLQKLANAGKSGGSIMIAQLNHCGRQTPININSTPFSSSDVQLNVRIKTTFGKPIPLTVAQIKTEVIDRFVFSAIRCYEAGFDGIEIHAAHGYLLTQFLSPTTNNRTDEYGGSPENRSRIIEEIYQAIRAKIPSETGFVIGIKLNSADCPQSGSLEDVTFIAKKIDRLGFDFIELSGGSYENWTLFHYKDSTKKREAFFVEFASAIKPQMNNSIVYLTGGFRSVAAMVQAVENNDLDGIGIAKPTSAEPDIARKMLEEGVQSAAFNFYETDYAMAAIQTQTQMGQAGLTTWAESGNDPCFGITDFSDEKEANKFKNGALKYTTNMIKSETMQGKPYIGLFEYDTKKNYSFCGQSVVNFVFGLYSRYIGFKK